MKTLVQHLHQVDTSRVSDFRAVVCHVEANGAFSTACLAVTKHDSLENVLEEVSTQVCRLRGSANTIYGLVVQDLTPEIADEDFSAPVSDHRLRFTRAELMGLAA